MENFARPFILRFDLQNPPKHVQGTTPPRQKDWRGVDRLLALYGPPDLVNHVWRIGANQEEAQHWDF